MVTVPPEIAVTKPVPLTVAMAVLLEVQGLLTFAVAEPVNCEVAPTQADNVPVIVGNAFAVKVAGLEVIDMVPEAVLVLTTHV